MKNYFIFERGNEDTLNGECFLSIEEAMSYLREYEVDGIYTIESMVEDEYVFTEMVLEVTIRKEGNDLVTL